MTTSVPTESAPLTDAEWDASFAAVERAITSWTPPQRKALAHLFGGAWLTGVLRRHGDRPMSALLDSEDIEPVIELGLVAVDRPRRGRTGAPHGGRARRRLRITADGWAAMAAHRELEERSLTA